MKSVIIGGVVFAALLCPAFANEYWVEYDYQSHQCSIVEKKTDPNQAAVPPSGPEANPTPKVASAPTGGTVPTMLPGSQAPAPVEVGQTGAPNGTPAPGVPATAAGTPNNPPGSPTASNPDEQQKDPYAATASAWAQKKAAAEAAGTADIQTAFIGTAMHSRQEAENEMQIMRKCGIAN